MKLLWSAYIRPAFALIGLFTVLTGVAMPLIFVGGATAIAPHRAGGSLVARDGRVVGSALIGQNFTSPKYFHPRPSGIIGADPKDPNKTVPTPYDAANSNASNLGPTNGALIARVKADMGALGLARAPADMVTTSASGLDLDISVADAELQVARVAAARHLPADQVRSLMEDHAEGRVFGIFGEPHVNVLALNLALDSAMRR